MNYAVRGLASMLVAGGVLGVFIAIYLAYQSSVKGWTFVGLSLIFVAVFAWTVVTGVRLWRGDRRGEKWAKILYAAQIPTITAPGFTYEYYTGLFIGLVAGAEGNLRLRIGAGLSLFVDSEIRGLVYGINFVALAAVIYLFQRPRADAAVPDRPLGE